MSKLIDLTGQRFGRLVVIESVGRSKYRYGLWRCKCDCGNEVIVATNLLHRGKTQSCGCYKIDKNTTHGQSGTRLYWIWGGMINRCTNSTMHNYNNYGGRGITVCDEWRTFEPFYEWAITNGYREDLTIDRIDTNGNYCPENCRWATPKQQANNKRNNRLLTLNGITHTMTEWSEITGLSVTCICLRLDRYRWSVEDALTKPSKYKGDK